jgi:phosphoglycolate phosphatase (TIGR01487 family)
MTKQIPLILDIDGTITSPEEWRLDPRIINPIRSWDGPVIFATGKAFPYPVMLCRFLGIGEYVVAENGGVVYDGKTIEKTTNSTIPFQVAEEYINAGYELGPESISLANRWRETEMLVHKDQPLQPLQNIIDPHDVELIDTGFAYHIKDPTVMKGDGIKILAESLGFELQSAIAIGDSINDVSVFEIVGESFAVGNADSKAREVADHVVDEEQADGTIKILKQMGDSAD